MAKEMQASEEQSHWTDSDATQDLFPRRKERSILVPIGCLTTAAILAGGLWTFKNGKVKQSQYWMRARVLSQFTTVLLMGGSVYGFNFNAS